MKRGIICKVAVLGLMVAFSAGEAAAAGGRGAGRGSAGASMGAASTNTTRPAGSQRRDGTFLATGSTANGSTTHPGYGRGVQDGSRLTTTTTTTTSSTAQ